MRFLVAAGFLVPVTRTWSVCERGSMAHGISAQQLTHRRSIIDDAALPASPYCRITPAN